MIVCVLEISDLGSNLFFIDLDKLDRVSLVQRFYYDHIQRARQAPTGASETHPEASATYYPLNYEHAMVKPPCLVEDFVILKI